MSSRHFQCFLINLIWIPNSILFVFSDELIKFKNYNSFPSGGLLLLTKKPFDSLITKSNFIISFFLILSEILALISIGYFYDFLISRSALVNNEESRNNVAHDETSRNLEIQRGIRSIGREEVGNCNGDRNGDLLDTENDGPQNSTNTKSTKRQLLFLNGLGIGGFALFLAFIINDHDAALFYHIPMFGCFLLFKISLYMQLISLRVWSCEFNIIHPKHQFVVQSLNACCIGVGYIVSKILLMFVHSFAAAATIYSLAAAVSLMIYYFLISLGFEGSDSGTIFDFPIYELEIRDKSKPKGKIQIDLKVLDESECHPTGTSSSNCLKNLDDSDANSIAASTFSSISIVSEAPLPFEILHSSLFSSLKKAMFYVDREILMIWSMIFFSWTGVYIWCYLSINIFLCLSDCRNHDSDYYWTVWSWAVCISLALFGLICFLYFYCKKKAAYKSRFAAFSGIFLLFLATCIFGGLQAFAAISKSNFGYISGSIVFYESLISGILVGFCSMILFSFPYAYLTLHKKRHGGISLGLAVSFIESLILLAQLCSFSLFYADANAQIMVILAAVGLCLGSLISLYMKERMGDVDPLKRTVSHIAF